MATALSIALKSCIEDNWSAVTGGTEPTVYGTDHISWPSEDEWIRIMGWTFDMGGFSRHNESYIGYWEQITFEVSTKNHADLESRLDKMTTELRRIITPTNLTGYHIVDIVGRTRSPTDQSAKKWAEQMTVRATVLSTQSAITPGSTTTSTITVDTLTVNTSIAGSPTAALGTTTLSDDIKLQTTKKIIFDDDQDENNYMTSPSDTYISTYVENTETMRWYSSFLQFLQKIYLSAAIRDGSGDIISTDGSGNVTISNLAVTGAFTPRRVRQSAQPVPAAGELLVWSDSDDNKVYLVYTDATAGGVKVELT
ncbi:MAG: hypothetical protein ACYTBJ_06170 [Planctomycetota bacterium]|jgi:hypothetical protein